MSYQPRMGAPPLMVIGRTGACGKIKRIPGDCGRFNSGTTGTKSSPLAPSPCNQMTANSAGSPVLISMQSRGFVVMDKGSNAWQEAGESILYGLESAVL